MTTEDLKFKLEQLAIQPGSVLLVRCPPGMISVNVPRDGLEMLANYVHEHGGVCLLVPDGWTVESLHSDVVEALRAWHDAWLSQGEGRVLAMVEAHRRTRRALDLEENT